MDPFIGEIKLMAISYAPQGWALCDGTLLQINQNQTLYSLLGVQYGGDGRTTFALPDLRGRTPVHRGAKPNGTAGGSETITLTATQVPQHTHQVAVYTDAGNKNSGLNSHIAAPVSSTSATQQFLLYAAAGLPTNQVALDQTSTNAQPTVSSAGGGVAHENMQPWLALNYFIATTGTYPSRN